MATAVAAWVSWDLVLFDNMLWIYGVIAPPAFVASAADRRRTVVSAVTGGIALSLLAACLGWLLDVGAVAVVPVLDRRRDIGWDWGFSGLIAVPAALFGLFVGVGWQLNRRPRR